MITSKGKEVVAKYLIGETESYASYIAIGCGPKAVVDTAQFSLQQKADFFLKESLDMEMYRAKITSRGFVVENDTAEITAVALDTAPNHTGWLKYTSKNMYVVGQKVTITGVTPEVYNITDAIILAVVQSNDGESNTSFSIANANLVNTVTTPYVSGGTASAKVSKIVLTGEIPTEERYGITEVGIYPALSNPSAGAYDSRQISTFSKIDGWNIQVGSTLSEIARIDTAIDGQTTTNTIDPDDTFGKAFVTKSSNSGINVSSRILRQEVPRFLEDSVFVRGDLSSISVNNLTGLMSATGENHIKLSMSGAQPMGYLKKSRALDELKLAFSVISRDASNVYVPGNVKILIEFTTESDPTLYARYGVNLSHSLTPTLPNQIDFTSNRYIVSTQTMDSLEVSNNFAWSSVNTIKIYVDVIDKDNDTNKKSEFYVALDALRFENITSLNPVYGLVGYSVLKTPLSKPIVKETNKSSYIEFRYAVDVG